MENLNSGQKRITFYKVVKQINATDEVTEAMKGVDAFIESVLSGADQLALV